MLCKSERNCWASGDIVVEEEFHWSKDQSIVVGTLPLNNGSESARVRHSGAPLGCILVA